MLRTRGEMRRRHLVLSACGGILVNEIFLSTEAAFVAVGGLRHRAGLGTGAG